MSNQETFDVIIIGGGFAGVTALRDLRQAGRKVLLLEARDRLGGRTWYRKFDGTDQSVEIGGTWTVDRTQTHVAEEKKRYGLKTTQSPKPANWRMSLNGKIRDTWLPVELEELAGFERAIYHLIHDSLRITVGVPYDQQGLDDLDVSFEAWMNLKGISDGTRAFLSAFIGLNFGSAPGEVSALHFLTWIAGMGNSPWTMSTVLTDKFAEGTKSLIDAMVDEADGEIRLSSPVAEIEQDEHGVTVTTRNGAVMHASVAIVATPLNTWKDIDFSPGLSDLKAQAAAEGHAGHSVKPWALVKGAPEYFASWAWDGGMCWLSTEFQIDEGSVMVGFAHSGNIVDINNHADVAEKVKAFLPAEAEVIGVDGHDWLGDEFSQGTWLACKPGQLTRLHSGLMQAEGKLVFAGSDVALQWPGWIEGAIESGRAAAKKVDDSLRQLDPDKTLTQRSIKI